MTEPLDETYLVWLYDQVSSVDEKVPSRTYWFLMRQLFTTEFVWFVPNDDNRVEDGRDLRHSFMDEHGIDYADEGWMTIGCSVLEMLLGLSHRLTFECDGEPSGWFWQLLTNVDLHKFNDRYWNNHRNCAERVEEILNKIIWRTYGYDGQGGLFPLKHPEADQRETELWYQLSAYILEND